MSSPAATAARLGVAIVLGGMLVAAVLGGLLRAGAIGLPLAGSEFIGRAAVLHAALMLSSFLGSVIAVERAVALRQRWAYLAPLCGVAQGACLLLVAGPLSFPLAAAFGVLAALCFVAVNVVLLARQPQAHMVVMFAGSLAWLVGNGVYAWQQDAGLALLWWFAFVVLTITAERLEMARLMPRHPLSRPLLMVALLCLLAGLVTAMFDLRHGCLLFGVALLMLALWLVTFDVARRTVRTHGLSRYMALCLLSGYGWLMLSGLAWMVQALELEQGIALRDVALHALALGFVMSMVMGHAPVILPAVARVKVLFGPWFYAPLALLHGALPLRCAGAWGHPGLRSLGALLNAVAIALFVLTMLGSAWAWRRQHQHAEAPSHPA
ncbi:hypothetical protein [Herbaspirillum sp. NPDC087042]|uniref:hypothetical protein n=1 Tax=Herbaspirillum sp. NPDC087042 TaxID=3364004 RepID=UPI0037F8A33C